MLTPDLVGQIDAAHARHHHIGDLMRFVCRVVSLGVWHHDEHTPQSVYTSAQRVRAAIASSRNGLITIALPHQGTMSNGMPDGIQEPIRFLWRNQYRFSPTVIDLETTHRQRRT